MVNLKICIWQILAFIALLLLNSCGDSSQTKTQPQAKFNVLTDAEKSEGWILLFDGNSFVFDWIKFLSSFSSPRLSSVASSDGNKI